MKRILGILLCLLLVLALGLWADELRDSGVTLSQWEVRDAD